MTTKEFQQRDLRGLFEFNLFGSELDAYVKKQVADYREQAKSFGGEITEAQMSDRIFAAVWLVLCIVGMVIAADSKRVQLRAGWPASFPAAAARSDGDLRGDDAAAQAGRRTVAGGGNAEKVAGAVRDADGVRLAV